MPTIQFMDLPEPKNWQEFETIVRDAMMQRWKSSTLQMNGRPGQKQQGIDISGPDDIGRPIGIQCKKYDTLKIKTVTDEIKNAEDFKGKLTTLFVATTADHDARLQRRVQLLLPPEDASPIVEALVSLKGECLKPKSAKSDWDAAEMYAKRATMRINKASSFLTLLESSMLDLGLQLGRIYHHTNDLPTPEIRSSIEANVRSALPASSDGAITAKFASAAKLEDGYRWALRIYGLLEREIRLSL